MKRSDVPSTVNGGYIEQYELDLRQKLFTVRVDVFDDDGMSCYELCFKQLSYFAYDTESRSDPEARLQLTELSFDAPPEGSPTEEWEVTISIFDLSHIRLRCSTITVDGASVR